MQTDKSINNKSFFMELITEITVRKTNHSRINEVDFENLEFGKYIADHMLVCDYAAGEWKQPQIVPDVRILRWRRQEGWHDHQ